MIILDLDADGNGEGKLLPAMRARFSKDGTVELESMGTDPFRIISVKTRESK